MLLRADVFNVLRTGGAVDVLFVGIHLEASEVVQAEIDDKLDKV